MDRLNILRERIRNQLVDDIDYFPFPKKYLESSLENKTDEDFKIERKKYLNSKTKMRTKLLKLASLIKAGKITYPETLDLLYKVRQDKAVQNQDIEYLTG